MQKLLAFFLAQTLYFKYLLEFSKPNFVDFEYDTLFPFLVPISMVLGFHWILLKTPDDCLFCFGFVSVQCSVVFYVCIYNVSLTDGKSTDINRRHIFFNNVRSLAFNLQIEGTLHMTVSDLSKGSWQFKNSIKHTFFSAV